MTALTLRRPLKAGLEGRASILRGSAGASHLRMRGESNALTLRRFCEAKASKGDPDPLEGVEFDENGAVKKEK